MDLSVLNFETVTTLLLLMLIGLGPKIALVPFLEKTKHFSAEEQRAVGKQMVVTAVVAAIIVYLAGALLVKLLHITPGAVAVAGGMVLAVLAMRMALGSETEVESHIPIDPKKIAIYPLAVPYLFNPVGITVIIMASVVAESFAASALVMGLILLVGGLDYLVFTNADKLSKRLNPTSLVVSEIVFGVLLTAVAVQLIVFGLGLLGLITPHPPAH